MIANYPEFEKRDHKPERKWAKKVVNLQEKAPKPLSLSAKSCIVLTKKIQARNRCAATVCGVDAFPFGAFCKIGDAIRTPWPDMDQFLCQMGYWESDWVGAFHPNPVAA